MATQWYWRAGEFEMGPVSFSELTAMIRERTLNEDDLVRPHYSKDWQTTDSVIGLFHMANRVPVPRDEPVAGEMTADAAHMIPGRTYRLDEVTHGQAADGTQAAAFDDILAAAPDLDCEGGGIGSLADDLGHGSDWDSTMQAAIDHVDARIAAHEEFNEPGRGWLGRLVRLYRTMNRLGVLRQAVRFGVAALCAWGFSLWVTNCNSEEMLRFPSKNPTEQDVRYFPVIGACYVEDYWLLLGIGALMLGAATYITVTEVENRFLEIS